MGATFQVAFYPEALGHPDNNIPANPYSTPAHIVPEWYFLAVYAIQRSIPNKLAGVVVVGLVFAALALLPYMHKPNVRGPVFRLIHQKIVSVLIGDCFQLTWLGSMPVEPPFVLLGQQATRLFFLSIAGLCVSRYVEEHIRLFIEKKKKVKAISLYFLSTLHFFIDIFFCSFFLLAAVFFFAASHSRGAGKKKEPNRKKKAIWRIGYSVAPAVSG